jgi:hypothetical protein
MASATPLGGSAGDYISLHPLCIDLIQLTKWSRRKNRSRTETVGAAATMRDRVFQRNLMCWVSNHSDPQGLTNAHVCPKRMGDLRARRILYDFCGFPIATASILDPIFELAMIPNLDSYFDTYDLGFRTVAGRVSWHVPLRVYVLDIRSTRFKPGVNLNIFGVQYPQPSPVPLLHGHQFQPPAQQDSTPDHPMDFSHGTTCNASSADSLQKYAQY